MSDQNELYEQIATILNVAPRRLTALSGGCVGEVYRVEMADGSALVAKLDRASQPVLEREAFMLRYLTEHSRLPVPKVLYSSNRLLLIEYLPGDSYFSHPSQTHAAELLADLHNVTAPAYGLEVDTLIGGLHQPNPWTASWLTFFRDQRLLYMAGEAMRAGRLPSALFARIEKLAGRLQQWLEEPDRPALIHGDVWSGNVLAAHDRVAGFLDPAIYFADADIELAFITLFHTFSAPFFERYQEQRLIRPGFWEVRRDLYNLYPLLVHVRLFGGGYVGSVEETLRRFGV